MRNLKISFLIFIAFVALHTQAIAQTVPTFDHIVIVIGENTAASSVFGATDAPYINSLANAGAKFTSSYALEHPSQPNYLDLYSGGNQGVTDDGTYFTTASSKLTSANLGAELIAAGKTFATYSEDLPSEGYDGASSGGSHGYVRKHNPAANWMGTGTNRVPASTNKAFTVFPTNFASLPSVSFVVPNLYNDGHDQRPGEYYVSQYDTWVKNNLDAYKQWCVNNNSLLIVTYDEDDRNNNNVIATVFYGAKVKQGVYTQAIDHYEVLRFMEDANSLTTHAGGAQNATKIDFCWNTATADTQAPTAPTSLSAFGTTSSTTNLSWTASTDNVAVTGYNIYRGTTLITTVSSTSYTATGLSASTAYSFSIKAKDAAGNISAASNTVNLTTLAATSTYCSSTGGDATEENIGKVVLNTINKSSTNTTGYSDFTATSTNLVKGSSNTITITPNWPTASKYNEGYAVFIDYNQDKDFSDAGETVWTNAASQTSPVSGTFIVPNTATTGATRMRVSLKYNAIPTSCEAIQYGEVEDYTVNITAGGTTISYCSSASTSASYEYISNVKLGTINNTTVGSIYSDFTSTSTNLVKGSSNTISITPTWPGTRYDEGYAVYIDFNKDGDFADAGETVFTKSVSQTTPVSGNFLVPTDAAIGATRMRISMSDAGAPSSCGSFTYGEVEDYTVNITATLTAKSNIAGIATKATGNKFTIYPNPLTGNILYVKGVENNVTYTIENITGKSVASGKIIDGKVSLGFLSAGVYFIKIQTSTSTESQKFIKE